MDLKSRDFVEALVRESPGLQAVYRDDVDYWFPEEPPVTVLFGTLGRRIAEDFEHASSETNLRIFTLIESGMSDNDPQGEFRTALATGLIEALVNKAEQMKLWEHISKSFGRLSRDYVDAWFAQQESIARTIAHG